jgi:RimJ/RimL family protein N-acetyltransferase
MMRKHEAGPPFSHWDSDNQLETERLSIFPCDPRSLMELDGILNDPRVYETYFVAAPRGFDSTAPNGSRTLLSYGRPRSRSLNFAVKERRLAVIIGAVQFCRNDLSYFVRPEFWRQGYGFEMVDICCRSLPQCFGLEMIRASVIRENIGSRRILEKIGFAFGGMFNRPWAGRFGVAQILEYKLRVEPSPLRCDWPANSRES